MKHLIAYDIADPKRLQRVARFFERRAVRVQKSVFVYDGTRAELERMMDEAARLIHVNQDVVQAWRLALDESGQGLARGAAALVEPACLVAEGAEVLFVAKGSA